MQEKETEHTTRSVRGSVQNDIIHAIFERQQSMCAQSFLYAWDNWMTKDIGRRHTI